MENYEAKIDETSREFTAKERVALKTFANAHPLDDPEMDGAIIEPVGWAVIQVHNEKSDNKDYNKYLIIAKDGEKYVTGSLPFWRSFKEIWEEMEGVDEDWGIAVRRKESKNYKGKEFITCEII